MGIPAAGGTMLVDAGNRDSSLVNLSWKSL